MVADLTTDVLVIGGGPAGAAVSMRLLDRGITPLIVERETFPRYHIGESMTGELGGLVREMGFENLMGEAGHPVKEGVCVFSAQGANNWWVPMMRRDENMQLVAAPTWQVRRSVFDAMLLEQATQQGANRLQGRAVEPIMTDDGTAVEGIRVRTDDGSMVDVRADITLDCSGQATFLANRKVTGPKFVGSYDKQVAFFSQVTGYRREQGSGRYAPGNAHIYYKEKYHWAWAIPLDEDVTSVGVVVPAQFFHDSKLSKEDFLRLQYQELNPGLAERLGDDPELVESVHVIPNYSFQVRRFAGPGFMCIGDAHRFVDPIFSFGMYVAAAEAKRAAGAIVAYLEGEGRDSPDPFHEYMVDGERAIDILEDMIDTFWENPIAFAVFVHNRYREALVDVFSGRIYDGMTTGDRDVALGAFRRLLGRTRAYDDKDLFSVPIGSRFHPERAPLWDSTLDSVETTEQWLRDQD